MAKWTSLPDELDPAALDLVLSAFKGQLPSDKAAAFLVVDNVAGYAQFKVLGQPHVMQAAPEMMDVPTVEAAFEAAKQHCTPQMMGSGPVGLAIPWALILSVAIRVLSLLASQPGA